MLAYATESQKGKFIGIFWGIFNLGAVVGASVSLGQNFHSTVRVFMPSLNKTLLTDFVCAQANAGKSNSQSELE